MSTGVNFEIPDLVYFDKILQQHDYHRYEQQYEQYNRKMESNFGVYIIKIMLKCTIFKMYNKF